MRRVFRHIAVAALLFAALPLRAQWSGGLDLAGGYGWMPPFAEGYDPLNHALGQGGGRVMLRKPTLRWETRLNEFFDFRAIRIEPYFAVDWGWRTWRAHVDYAVQLYTRRFNEIDQTFFKETIDGREYKVFTWLNSADGLTTGVLEQLGWQGEVLSFQAGVNYTGTKRVARASGKEKLTTEWRAWEPNGISDMAVFCYLCTR